MLGIHRDQQGQEGAAAVRRFRQAWLVAPPTLVMGTSMLAWPKPPYLFVGLEWGFGMCGIILAVVARKWST